jgi:hypothetical protein
MSQRSSNGILGTSPTANRKTKASTSFIASRVQTPGTSSVLSIRVTRPSLGHQTKSLDLPLDKGPQIVEAKRDEPLKVVKPHTEGVRREID